ncbi:plasmid partitioning protein RepB [Albimonas sp. CAU 1670]|uniref:plasmid partitioning protein RepB n=1 Tax=Albimonas sp. CAU 1670 TaxID=3032599 RepID=UPI0023D99C2D|nr:plasmid partitioning protein RepB [Albimonas sp. CAU 1670]MDF2235891.1 plasmid partitioning protein RepB [Albimonas sp. CAU 1670]
MSRKDRKSMLEGLMAAPAEGTEPAAADEKLTAVNAPSRPRPVSRSGAVGAISSAVSALRASGVLELDPATIHAGGLEDRIETSPEDDALLRRSIAAHGQQVPVLVRPHPSIPGEWQIVYGRRRARAAQELGLPVKALVRDLDDEALVMAQGQENSARRDLSFVEKASFAARMQEAGYDRGAIGEALSVDKTAVSRMLSLTDRLPRELIRAIGSAPGVGRPRWLKLAETLEAAEAADVMDAETLADEVVIAAGDAPSAERFEAAATLLRSALRGGGLRRRPARPSEIRALDGRRLAVARRTARGLTLSLAPAGGFEDWLASRLPELHAAWRRETRAPDPDQAETSPPES